MPESRGSIFWPFRAALAEGLQTRRAARASRNRQAGQALALTAVSLAILLLAAGLAIDTGVLRYQKRRIQAAADAAAIAAADDMSYSPAQTTATNEVTANGFGNAQVTANCSTSATGGFVACGSGNNNPYVQVTVSQQEPLYFMKIIPGDYSPTVSALATAHYTNGPNCMYALGVGATIAVSGSAVASTSLKLDACGLISNGEIDIQQCVGAFDASAIGYSGSPPTLGCTLNTTPHAIAATASNPLAYLTPPGAPGTCTSTTPPPLNGNTYNLMPGTPFPCGIQITGNATVTFASGNYVLGASPTGYAFQIVGNNNTVTGNGVTFYNATGQVLICMSPSVSPIATNCPNNPPYNTPMGNSINLTAPTTGTYAGVLFYQDPADFNNPGIIVGNDAYGPGNTNMEGIFYFPTASLTLAELTDGTNWQMTYNAAVANTITLVGTVWFGSYYASLPNGSPIKDAILVQ